jgi:hypothetical protein
MPWLPCSKLCSLLLHMHTGSLDAQSLVTIHSVRRSHRCRWGLTLNEFWALGRIDTPATNISMHLHRSQHEVLINVEIHSMFRVKVSITIYNVTPEFGLSITTIRAHLSCILHIKLTGASYGWMRSQVEVLYSPLTSLEDLDNSIRLLRNIRKMRAQTISVILRIISGNREVIHVDQEATPWKICVARGRLVSRWWGR